MSKVSGIWGKQPEQFYAELRHKPVIVKTCQGSYRGKLIGMGVYALIIEQPGGLELLLPKGNIIYIHAAGAGAGNDDGL